ncbi:TetR/AcrR family transcriptional regulator [Tsukamurella soli]|uniref:TetR/AcrR family transcriptional regulator C-terminal domain-containing protein n=1 Tax=Tsukamurella soli TaxID=644556 RepID=A0ABP8KF16_9ACTN
MSNPAVKRGRPPRGSTTLTRDAVVDAALAVIDKGGVGAVGMRAVARTLGVDPKSLYNHVADLDDVLDALAERLLGSIEIPTATGDLRADLRAIAHAFRDRALVHPHAASLVLTRQLSSLEGLAPTQATLSVLRAAGFPPDEATHLLRVLLGTLIGLLLREVDAGPTYGSSDPAAIAQRTAALEASGLPEVAAAASHLARFDGAEEFDFAVGLAVDAVSARARAASPGS